MHSEIIYLRVVVVYVLERMIKKVSLRFKKKKVLSYGSLILNLWDKNEITHFR